MLINLPELSNVIEIDSYVKKNQHEIFMYFNFKISIEL